MFTLVSKLICQFGYYGYVHIDFNSVPMYTLYSMFYSSYDLLFPLISLKITLHIHADIGDLELHRYTTVDVTPYVITSESSHCRNC
jgi:hypothetical protein